MTAKRLFHFMVVVIMAFALAACERQKIGDVMADPGRFKDKEINVAGKVTQSMGFMNWGAYEIDDGTGKLWVIAEKRGVPSKGATVGVKGRVYPTLTFMGRNFATAMRESDRKAAE